MSEVEKLVRKRGAFKAALTHFTKFVEQNRERVLNDTDIIQLQDRLTRIENVYQEFSQVQGDIELEVPLAQVEEQYTERFNFDESYFAITAVAKSVLEKSSPKIDDDRASVHSGSRLSAGASAGVYDNLGGIKLPVIPLPKFRGSFQNWLEFKETFQSLVHESESLSLIQKFHYLRASLEDNAAQVIKSIEFTSGGYNIAWQSLNDRYNNSKLLVHNHLKALFSLEKIPKESSSKIRKLVDDVSKHLRSLEQLDQVIQNWDPLLIFMITSKLDQNTLNEWEKHSIELKSPKLENLKDFLKHRADILETLEYKMNAKEGLDDRQGNKRSIKPREVSRSLVSSTYACYYCKKEHSIYTCDSFRDLSVKQRHEFVKKAKLCTNCLRQHASKFCKMGPCKVCRAWHNSLLHQENNESAHVPNVEVLSNEGSSQVQPNEVSLSSGISYQHSSNTTVLLSTAQVSILDKSGKPRIARVLLDSGSMSSFITESLCDELGLDRINTDLNIFGISNVASIVRKRCSVRLNSLRHDFHANLTCFILPEITSAVPGFHINLASLNVPKDLDLADEDFNKPGPVEILIGGDLFWNLLRPGRITGTRNGPIFQDTALGWIVAGQLGTTKLNLTKKEIFCNLSTHQELQNILVKFWEIEEFDTIRPLSKDEQECERIFSETTRRDCNGRFVVTLPLKKSAECLGESRSQAEKMFYNTERRLLRNQPLREQYVKFMQEYQDLNHMTLCQSEDADLPKVEYFMPHHGVLKNDSLTTKLRVVFNASSPSSNGISLNNIQYVGPVLQDELFSIILRFRQSRYVVSADCKMMYRQILVEPEQRPLQKIVWRANPTEQLRVYNLNTVTYGQTSASFLAIRCLFELANQCEDSHPDIASIIRRCFYVDDLLFSVETIEEAQYICRKVSDILKDGCFELRKWYSNELEILKDINSEEITCGILNFGPDERAKTLGLTWSCGNDKLFYSIENTSEQRTDTKRTVLSLTAKIFDPLGLLSPTITIAKILMQKLWCQKMSWDEPLPEHLAAEWRQFKDNLLCLNNLAIERHVVCQEARLLELHGFSDASERAYGACLYVRSVDRIGNIYVKLLSSKSKVAPIKTLSIPRLELCGALLLARLTNKVRKSLTLKFENCILWTDSTVTLAWIQSSPNLLKTFVATRVSTIQALTDVENWRHVPTDDNPADYLSRGLGPQQILVADKRWQGPDYLKKSPAAWPMFQYKINEIPELKTPQTYAIPTTMLSEFPFERFSKYVRLNRVAAYILRFSSRKKGPLGVSELNDARKILVKTAQKQSFPDEYSDLLNKRPLDTKSKILSLAPYLDQDEIIRVGGRLQLSESSADKKHPIVLHSSHHFTKLLFAYEHVRLMHSGSQLLLSAIRDEFWPVSGRDLARATVRQCVSCFRFKPDIVQPIMANLPRDRIVPSPPFHISGLDYAGPFLVRRGLGRGRNCTLEKCYIGVFVCFTTKALHIELIPSLSTQSFLQALRRFVSRRGKPSKIVSDNGTTFVGASRELREFLVSDAPNLGVALANEGIDWQFICPYSPHMGGLWESSVKSIKYHLKRVLADARLTFEEFTTALCQIEAILNSRPLCPLSSDPNDLSPLTPAHFLIGRKLVAAPDENLEEVKVNRLTRFQLVQRICQHFWQRWHREYLSELQRRQKWKCSKGELTEGLLVLLKDDQSLPNQWRLGRIVKLHPGADGVARIASIKRNFQKICPLPMAD